MYLLGQGIFPGQLTIVNSNLYFEIIILDGMGVLFSFYFELSIS